MLPLQMVRELCLNSLYLISEVGDIKLIMRLNLEEMEGMRDAKDSRLNTKACLHSLGIVRRTDWFHARAYRHYNCVLVIRIMRDFCLRNPLWMKIDFWVM